jgi:putrescine transport system ATP-binding protein
MALLEIVGVRKSFGAVIAVDDVSLTVERGTRFALLGPSGCGKTTLSRMIAGFETPEHGHILIDGVEVTALPPYARPVNMMFQSYALFPHMDVAANIAFGLRHEGMDRRRAALRVGEMLALVQMSEYGRRRPHELSGGQRQRVALARALAKMPKLLLLDEPLAALVRKLRAETRLELIGIQERVGTAFLVVTHDQEEALSYGFAPSRDEPRAPRPDRHPGGDLRAAGLVLCRRFSWRGEFIRGRAGTALPQGTKATLA